jgi:selenocysteine lyase/cysteine desulfurase
MLTRRGWRFSVDDVSPLVDGRTRVLAVSAVDWQSGFRADLVALGDFCRQRGLLYCVDAVQAVGALRVDVAAAGIDCLAAGGHKWLIAPEGCGGLVVSGRIADQVRPVVLGWRSVTDAGSYLPYHFELRKDAGRFEPGTLSHVGILALGAALDLFAEVGADRIEQRILHLTAELAEGLRSRGADILSPWQDGERSGILTFRLGDSAALAAALEQAGIIARTRAGGVRLAPHFYNSADDIARVLDAVDGYMR